MGLSLNVIFKNKLNLINNNSQAISPYLFSINAGHFAKIELD